MHKTRRAAVQRDWRVRACMFARYVRNQSATLRTEALRTLEYLQLQCDHTYGVFGQLKEEYKYRSEVEHKYPDKGRQSVYIGRYHCREVSKKIVEEAASGIADVPDVATEDDLSKAIWVADLGCTRR